MRSLPFRPLAPALLGLLLFFPLQASAQLGGAQLLLGIPQGEFGERLDGSVGFGIGAQLLYQIPNTPVLVGGDLGFLTYGQETLRECFTASCRVEVDVITTNNIAMGHFLLRLQPFDGAVQPYLDGLAGFNYLFTQSRVQDTSGQQPELASTTNFDDLAFSAGFGGGLQIRVLDQINERGRRNVLLIDGRVRYLFGGEAEYLKRGAIEEQNGQPAFAVERSATTLLLPQLGVTFRF